MSLKFNSRLILVVLLLLAFSISGQAKLLPTPTNYVEDKAGIIDAVVEQRLNILLKEVEQKTTIQFIILTVNSTDGQPIGLFALEHAEKWKLGKKYKDNGILFVTAVKDKKYRFEVGYGLEAVLPDSFLGTAGRQYLVPNFKSGNYSRGILEATGVLLNKIGKEYNVGFSGVPKVTHRSRRGRRKTNPLSAIIGFIFFGIIFFMMPPRMRSFLLLYMLMGGGRRGYGGYGRSSGFGGFGGFGGGGGGSFGGGGASGGW